MEQQIENYIDNILGSYGPHLLSGNIISGIIVALVGIIFMVKKSPKKNLKTIGLICVGVGVASIISGWMQIQMFQ